MQKRNREFNVFSLSAIDLFCSGMGAIRVLTVILMPYYLNTMRSREIEVVFVIDTSGSMSSEIEELRDSLKSITIALQRMSKKLSIGVVQFKDRGYRNSGVSSAPLKPIPHVTAERPSSTEMDLVLKFIAGLAAGDGGFTGANNQEGEAVRDGLREVLQQSWAENPPPDSRQVVILVGDDIAHPDEVASALAAVRDWQRARPESRLLSCIFTGQVGSEPHEFFKKVATEGKGGVSIGSGGLMAAVLDQVLIDQAQR